MIPWSLVVVVLVVSQVWEVGANPLPPSCSGVQPSASSQPACAYSTTKDACGNTVCLKGPGEMCGGKFSRYGSCADGLMCSNCNRCQGCSFRTFMCWDDKNCIW